MTPHEAIHADPPNIWLTSFYDFTPETWGFLGFTNDGHVRHFLRETQPGVLLVVYGHKSKSPPDKRGKVIGIQQMTHDAGYAQDFMSPTAWEWKEGSVDTQGRWNNAFKAARAWHVSPDAMPPIEAFAPNTYSIGAAQHIGSYGVRLQPHEAANILDLSLVETSVYGQIPVDDAALAPGRALFAPSKAGPVSQQPFVVREAEGPKSLYILVLEGGASAFLGYATDDEVIVKVGMSGSPASRCKALNAALPNGAFQWRLSHCNERDERAPWPSSKPALAGEAHMKERLMRHGSSLGGEFFLASPAIVDQTWRMGCKAADKVANGAVA